MDFEIVIIGSGPGGYVAAIKAGQLGFKTALIEKDPFLGGTCLNVGCIPSKSLLQSSEHFYHAQHHLKSHGIYFEHLSFNFSEMQKRKDGVVSGFRGGLTALMKKNKVQVFQGTATFTQDHEITLTDGQKISFKNAIIATGSTPMELPFLPFDERVILSSTGALKLESVPKTMGVVGAGVIGVELGSVYARLGSKVTIIEFLDKIVPMCDLEISKAFQKVLEEQGIQFHLSSKVLKADKKSDSILVTYEKQGAKFEEEFDSLLVCVGRKPNTQNLGLENIQIPLDSKGFIQVNNRYQTSKPHIFAIGDVVGQPMLAHKASDEGVAVVSHLAGLKVQLNLIAIPNVIYTDPEVAACGLTEQEAQEMKLPFKTVQFPMKANSRAKASMVDTGFIKLIVHENGYLLGAHLLAAHAGELIQPLIVLIDQKIKIKDYEHIPHAHPTLVEAVKEAVMAAISKPIHY